MNTQQLPHRQRPEAIIPYLESLHLCQRHFPKWVEVPIGERKVDTVLSQLRGALKAWMTHQWECPLDLNWWQAHYAQVSVSYNEGRIWLQPKGEKIINPVVLEGEGVIKHFPTCPEDEVCNALALLLDQGVLDGEIRCNEPLPDGLEEKYENIKVWKPEEKDYWVMI